MLTFASLMQFSQSAVSCLLFLVFNAAFIKIC
jgi:hypothetical protein